MLFKLLSHSVNSNRGFGKALTALGTSAAPSHLLIFFLRAEEEAVEVHRKNRALPKTSVAIHAEELRAEEPFASMPAHMGMHQGKEAR